MHEVFWPIGSCITSDHGVDVLSREAINFPMTISPVIATEPNITEPVGVLHSTPLAQR